MKKHKNLIAFILLIAIVIGSVAWNEYRSKKIAYVSTTNLYDGFTLKKELEDKYKKTQLTRQTLLDSLKFKIQALSIKGKDMTDEDKIRFNDLQRSYLYKEKEFNDENDLAAQQYSDQIWKQINQYVADYGKENGYDYLLGATGQGNIMFAKEKEDITKEVLDYINKKYSGVK